MSCAFWAAVFRSQPVKAVGLPVCIWAYEWPLTSQIPEKPCGCFLSNFSIFFNVSWDSFIPKNIMKQEGSSQFSKGFEDAFETVCYPKALKSG